MTRQFQKPNLFFQFSLVKDKTTKSINSVLTHKYRSTHKIVIKVGFFLKSSMLHAHMHNTILQTFEIYYMHTVSFYKNKTRTKYFDNYHLRKIMKALMLFDLNAVLNSFQNSGLLQVVFSPSNSLLSLASTLF